MFNTTNQKTAMAGFAHEDLLIELFPSWRVQPPLWPALAPFDFLQTQLFAEKSSPGSKSDFYLYTPTQRFGVSVKLVSPSSQSQRATHHLDRSTFERLEQLELLSPDPLIKSALMNHFIDGQSLGLLPAEQQQPVLDFFKSRWHDWAKYAVLGSQRQSAPDFILISVLQQTADHNPNAFESCLITSAQFIDFIAQGTPLFSIPQSHQLGTIGTAFMHLQRGQALSVGFQRDIQTKCAPWLAFEAFKQQKSLASTDVQRLNQSLDEYWKKY